MKIPIRVVKHWVAGENTRDAIKRAKEKNEEGISAIINFLGEHLENKEEVQGTVEEYLKILKFIEREKVRGSISVKLTQLGLDIDYDYCFSNVEKLVKEASLSKILVWIDMEDSRYTQDTLDLYSSLLKKYDNMGVTIQSNLRRSKKDVETLVLKKAKIRLVKGAYREKAEIGYESSEDIISSFLKLTKILLEKGNNIAIATHDEGLIKEAIELNRRYNRDIEFQMLMGIEDKLKKGLVEDGYRVADYIPFGKDWLSYFIRRVKERKEIAMIFLRDIMHI